MTHGHLLSVLAMSKYGSYKNPLHYRDLLLEKRSLTVPILDALSNLNLNPELMTEVTRAIDGNSKVLH